MERNDAGVRPGANDYILETRGLTMEFRGFVAVRDVDLNVRRHTIHALIGPNGAGKTTCFNLLTKFLTPTAGSIVFNGQDVTRTGPAAMARLGMVRSFQISSIFSHLTVIENVRVALQRKLGTSFHFWKAKRSLYPLHARADELIEWVGLEAYRDVPAGDLSYGRKRVLELATTLALDPELLLLDEPMAGLGHEDIDRVAELIRRVSDGRSVLMVEHNLDVVSDLSDTITVLTRGSILAEGDYDSVSRNPAVREAYIGGVHA
ncbi:ABC transporter ATP-binding protein (plasmid) [Agrobacterium leguminum]|uniref:Branched-chain amino acid transport system ATP-binding protein n=1 Tax=Agrobacterium deltaense NCPPB 1641 TaxID=1183425 RepID=A0A1S7U8U0_9HYPH|nr:MULTISPECIES: ABC transporter ATP-binding protein [Agrobacterium]WFS70014.1 ABC transporter ATP-binding protein [Agrobacterium leguminum]CVI63257.1 putative branched-chain amino acid transport system ATP-binding protein [Agrobacterium deltaense NCPPB 1641]